MSDPKRDAEGLDEIQLQAAKKEEVRDKIREQTAEQEEILDKIRKQAAEIVKELQPSIKAWNAISQEAKEKYNLSEEELNDILLQAPELHSMEWRDFISESVSEEDALLAGGLLDTIIKKSREQGRPVAEIVQEVQSALDTPDESLKQFLKNPDAFMLGAMPRGMEKFMSINDANQIVTFSNGLVIGYPNSRLGINEQKIHVLIRIAFSKANFYKAKNGLNTYVSLPFMETMRVLKKKPTEANIKKFRQRLIKEILPEIAHQYIEIKEKDGAVHHIEIGGGYFKVDRKNDRITFKVSDPYAVFLSTAPLKQYSSRTFELGDQNNPLPFYLALKLQDHYFHYGNTSRHTNDILSIKKLLIFCADTIPSYEYIQEHDPGHWVREIKNRLENALNDIEDGGLFEWEYCTKGLGEVDQAEVREMKDYYKWSSLYITFKLIPDGPDMTDLLDSWHARIEESKTDKAVKDAEKIIKADEILKRKKKKGTS